MGRITQKLMNVWITIIEKGGTDMRQLVEGDKIFCAGHKVTIKQIAFQEPWEWRNAWYLEFTDTNGVYRSWKQNFDGGIAFDKDDNEIKEELR